MPGCVDEVSQLLLRLRQAGTRPSRNAARQADWEQAEMALAQVGRPAVEALCQLLGTPGRRKADCDARASAARVLGQIGDLRALEPLCVALGDRRDVVRSSAADALGRLGDLRAIEPLCQAARQGSPGALAALLEMGDAGTLARRIVADRHMTPTERVTALKSLGTLPAYREARHYIRHWRKYCHELLSDSDPAVSKGAAALLHLRLLRPAAPPATETLLRPAHGAADTPPDLLLRPTESPAE